MKIFQKIGMVIFIGLIVLNMITYNSCNNLKQKYQELEQEKEQLITKFDSVLKLPPDTIKLPPKIVKKDSLIYVTKWVKEPTEEAKIYLDSLINDSIDVRLQIWAKELFKIDYKFKPIYKYQETIVEKKIPYPVEVIRKIKVPQSGLFFNAGLGYSDQFSAKLGLMYLTKKQSTIGLDMVRYGDKNIYFGTYGIKF